MIGMTQQQIPAAELELVMDGAEWLYAELNIRIGKTGVTPNEVAYWRRKYKRGLCQRYGLTDAEAEADMQRTLQLTLSTSDVTA